jgi:hypothetical protein
MSPSGSGRRRDLGGPPSGRDANRGPLGQRGRLEDGGVGKKEGLCRAGAELPGEGMGVAVGRTWPEASGWASPGSWRAAPVEFFFFLKVLTWMHLVPVFEFYPMGLSCLGRPREEGREGDRHSDFRFLLLGRGPPPSRVVFS